MTKAEFKEYALRRGVVATYSGKMETFFLKRVKAMNINKIITSKV